MQLYIYANHSRLLTFKMIIYRFSQMRQYKQQEQNCKQSYTHTHTPKLAIQSNSFYILEIPFFRGNKTFISYFIEFEKNIILSPYYN